MGNTAAPAGLHPVTPRRRARRLMLRIVAPLLAVTIAAMVWFAAAAIGERRSAAEQGVATQALLVRGALGAVSEELSRALQRLIERGADGRPFEGSWDTAELDSAFGVPGAELYDIDLFLAVRRAPFASYASLDGSAVPLGQLLVDGLGDLAAGAAPAAGGPQPILVRLAGRPAVATLRPLFGDGDQADPGATATMLIAVASLDEQRLASIARQHGLQKLAIYRSADTVPANLVTLRLTAADGLELGLLGWQSPTPSGPPLLGTLLPLLCGLLGAGLVVGLLVAQVLRQASDGETQGARDALTGLPNRLLLFDRLEQLATMLRSRPTSAALIYMDLDGFKEINDRHGHAVGDAVLLEVAQRLQAICRVDDTVARLGGDEFVLVAPGTSEPVEIERLAKRVLAALEEPIRCCGIEARVGASLGIARIPEDGIAGPELVAKADLAMYEAKRAGGSGWRFAASVEEDVPETAAAPMPRVWRRYEQPA